MRCYLRPIVAILSLSCCVSLPTGVGGQPTVDQLENQPAKAAARKPDDSAQPAGRESGYLGLIVDDRQEQGRGARVVKILPGGAAEQAGIAVGDLIVAIEGRKTRTLDEMAKIVGSSMPGSELRFEFERDEKLQQIVVTLGRRPPTQPIGPELAIGSDAPADGVDAMVAPRRRLLGIRTVAVTEDIRELYDLPAARGALVSEVLVGSPAHAAGVPLDAVIVEADSKPIATPEDLARAVAAVGPGKEIELRYLSRGQLVSKRVRLDDNADEEQVVARPQVPSTAAPASADRARIEQLERRVRELEAQIVELLQRLEEKSPGN